jgi:hypothetical protein
MSYMVDKSPVEDKLLNVGVRPWEPKEHRPVLTASRSAYKPYSTYVEWHSAQIGSIRMLTLANTKQRQEQVHSVDAQVRTPVEQSATNRELLPSMPTLHQGVREPALLCKYCTVRRTYFKSCSQETS